MNSLMRFSKNESGRQEFLENLINEFI